MKLKLFLFALTALLITACGKGQKASSADTALSDLENEINAYASGLPEDIGDGLVITDCLLTGSEVLYICQMDDQEYILENSPEVRQAIKQGIAEWMEQERNDSDIREMLKLCVKADRGIGFQYVGTMTSTTITVHFTSSELSRLLQK